MSKDKILVIGKGWKTVDYPESSFGSAELISIIEKAGMSFMMEAIDGYWMYELTEDIKVNILKTHGKTAMLDDPLNWIGMQRLAEHSHGEVCVAGLGLGMIVHHLVKNDKVTKIDVVEYNLDVIRLIKPTLPKDDRINVIHCDAFQYPYDGYDTIIFDIVTSGRDDFGTDTMKHVIERANMIKMRAQFNTHRMPIPKIMIWGLREKKWNPSVKNEEEYEGFLKRFMKATI